MDFSDILNGILVLLAGGILGGIGTYFIKPELDAWLDKRKRRREVREAARQKGEEAAKQRQEADRYALEYRDKLVHELRNLRILDMVRPLDLERTYVRVSIQEEQPQRYVDAEEMAALAQGDPNLLFELTRNKLAEDKVESLFPEEALRRYPHMVVLGDPGAGKTTMLKYLCLLSAQGKLSGFPDLPLFVTLNRYAKTAETSLFDFILAELAERYGFQEASHYLRSRMDEGSVLLLLDGLDEVTVGSLDEAETVYGHTVNQINHLATRYPKCPIVVTSRRAGWKGLVASNFMIMAVLDFTWKDIQHFVENWFGTGSDRSRDLQNRLSRQIRMQALAANPLLLSLIAIVFEQDLELPERRAKLYERCVHVLLTEWDAHRGIKRTSHFTVDRKRDLLEDVALHFHGQGLRYFPRHDLLNVIASYLPTVNIPADQAELVLAEISAQHALLKEQATDWYGFLHLTLQEYFAAVRLDRGNELDQALAQMHNPWWEEVILLLAGMRKDAAPLLNAIVSERDDIFFSNLLLAGRCLAGTPRIGRVELREQIITKLKTLIENEDQYWLPRTQAVRTLSEIDGEKSSKYLLKVLRDQNLHGQVGAAAVDALSSTGRKAVVHDLLTIILDEQIDFNLRGRVVDALINLCDNSTIPHLLALLSNKEIYPQVRGRIARALGYLGNKAAIPHLLELFADETLDDYIGWYTGRALDQLKAMSNPADLRRLLGNEKINLVARWSLAKAIGNLDQASYSEVIRWLSDNSLRVDVRWNIARSMVQLNLNDQTIKDELLRLYSQGLLEFNIRACVGIVLLHLGEQQVVSELKQCLTDSKTDFYIKKKISEALVEWGAKDVAPQLMTVLREDMPRAYSFVRVRITDLLANLGDSSVANELLSFLRDEQVEPRIRARAADTLSTLDLNGLIDNIRILITDKEVDPLVRGQAAYCLVQHENGVDWLVELLDQEDIRESIYLALNRAVRRFNVRVFAKATGGYEVLPLQKEAQ